MLILNKTSVTAALALVAFAGLALPASADAYTLHRLRSQQAARHHHATRYAHGAAPTTGRRADDGSRLDAARSRAAAVRDYEAYDAPVFAPAYAAKRPY